MNKKTSPRATSRRRSFKPRFRRAETVARRNSPTVHPTTLPGRLKRFLPGLAVAPLLVFVSVLIVVLGGIMFTASSPHHVVPASAALWLMSYGAPLRIEGVTLSVVPLVPVIAVIALSAARIRAVLKSKISVIDLAVVLACVLTVPLLLTIGAWFILRGNEPVEAPSLALALARSGCVAAVGYILGVSPRLWRAVFKKYGLPPTLVDGFKDATRFLAVLAVVALVSILVLGAAGYRRQIEVLGAYPDTSAAPLAALIAISVAYLPNAVVAAVSVLLGSNVAVGNASISLFDIQLVPLPPLPIFAAIPPQASEFAVLALLIPPSAAAFISVRANGGLHRLLGATIGAALIFVVAGYLSGGAMGYYGYTGPNIWMSAGLAALWFGLVGLATFGAIALSKWLNGRRGEVEPEPIQDEAAEEEGDHSDPVPSSAADEANTDAADNPEDVNAEVDEPEDAPEDETAQPQVEQPIDKEEDAQSDEEQTPKGDTQ